MKIEFTRINNDINGNPRYICHFLDVLTETEYWQGSNVSERYEMAVKKCKPFGGKKYRSKKFGGGIVFQSYNIEQLEKSILS